MIDYDRDPYSFIRRLFDGAPVTTSTPEDDLGWMARAVANDPTAGTTLFTASTSAVDRAGDVVDQSWRTGEYKANPVILDNHYSMRVAGKALSVSTPKDTGNLEINVLWDLENPDPMVQSVGHQHLNGFRSAGSVGFRAGKTTPRNKLDQSHYAYAEPTKVETPWGSYETVGNFYQQNTLYEFSSASVPMNPQALHRPYREGGKAQADLAARVAELDPADSEGRATLVARAAHHRSLADDLVGLLRSDPRVRRILLAHFESVPTPPRSTPRPVVLRGDGLDFLFPE